MVVVTLCLSTFTNNVLIAKLCAIPCATICNFLLMQFVVFRPPRQESEADQLPYSSTVGELD